MVDSDDLVGSLHRQIVALDCLDPNRHGLSYLIQGDFGGLEIYHGTQKIEGLVGSVDLPVAWIVKEDIFSESEDLTDSTFFN